MSTAFWPKRKVLVTGGSGFLGTHLTRRLVKCEAEVHATSRAAYDERPREGRWHQVDLTDMGAVCELLSKVRPDVLYHLSGSVTAVPNKELVLPTFHSLLTSTVNLLAAVAKVGCGRIILCGSSDEPRAQYGEMIPSSPYAAAKWAASGYGRMFHAVYGVPVVTLRIFMTYGPFQPIRRLIPSVIHALQENRPPKILNGRQRADWIYVDDVIDGLLAGAHSPNIEGCELDLGSGMLISNRGIVEQLVSIMNPSVKVLFRGVRDRPLKPEYAANIVDSEAKLNWRPTTSTSTGLLKTIEWHAESSRLRQ